MTNTDIEFLFITVVLGCMFFTGLRRRTALLNGGIVILQNSLKIKLKNR